MEILFLKNPNFIPFIWLENNIELTEKQKIFYQKLDTPSITPDTPIKYNIQYGLFSARIQEVDYEWSDWIIYPTVNFFGGPGPLALILVISISNVFF